MNLQHITSALVNGVEAWYQVSNIAEKAITDLE